MNSSQADENVAKIDRFNELYSSTSVDAATARHYGKIKSQLRKAGTPIPENDIWIAALGKQWSITIATRDHHFQAIDGFDFEMW